MNTDRIEELQDISNEFLRRLGEDEDNNLTNLPIKTEIVNDDKKFSNIRKLNMPNFSLSRIYKKENEKKISLVINNNIFNN